MTRRSFPHIDPADLRQHADEDRVERVWQRVERDLSGRAEGSSRVRSPLVLLAAAAAFGAFGAGILVGKTASSRAAAPSVTLAEPARDKSLVEVLAAGTHQSSFPLEGGGRVTLSPGATVEVERAGGAVTLSLLQGEASLDSAGRALTITAGDARINTQAGSVLTMRRTADDLDVKVDEGAVNVLSPDGQAVVGKSEHKVLPVRASAVVATMDAKATRDHAQQARRLPKPRLGAAKPLVVAEWYALYTRDDEKGAIASLRKLGVSQAIDAAHGAAELDAIAQLMGKGGLDAGAEIRAYERLVSAFPSDQRASLAAGRLARIYEGRGDAQRAKEFGDKVKPLLEKATEGRDALMCGYVRGEPDKTKALLAAKEYLASYPDGECREAFERLVRDNAPAPAASGTPSAEPAPPPPALTP